jgi:polyketide cyclase/dehydrase/lipid transport protein
VQVTTKASVDIARARDEVFDFACACDTYVRLFRPFGTVAGIVGAEMVDGVPLAAGALRRITLSDGAVLEEEVLAYDRPTRHAYRWSRGLRAPGRLLVRDGQGEWTFSAQDGHTRIDWQYTFTLTTPLIYPAAAYMLGDFRRWMEQALSAIDTALEA